MNAIIVYFIISLILTVPIFDGLDNARLLILSILFCPIVYIVVIFRLIKQHSSGNGKED